jgi:hypothetical protein
MLRQFVGRNLYGFGNHYIYGRRTMGLAVKNYHSFTVRKLAVECIPHIAVVFLYLIIAEGSRFLSEVFPLLFISLGILSVYFVGWRATLKKRSEKSLKYSYGQDDLAMECSCVFALFIMFGLFFQDLHHQFPGFFIVEDEATYLNWLLFTVENTFESVVDVLSIYDISLSGINPNDNVAKTVILLFRFTVNVVLILLIVRNWRNLRTYWQLNKKGKF